MADWRNAVLPEDRNFWVEIYNGELCIKSSKKEATFFTRKPIDFFGNTWYNNKAVGREREFEGLKATHLRENWIVWTLLRNELREKLQKKFWKNLLTNGLKCGIINKFAAKPDGSRRAGWRTSHEIGSRKRFEKIWKTSWQTSWNVV